MRRRITIELIILACLYGSLCPLIAMPFYNLLLFFPDKNTYDIVDKNIGQIQTAFGVTKTNVFFNAPNGMRLSGWYFKKAKADKVVLVSHGNAGNIAHRIFLAIDLIACDASVLLYDYEGYGKSEGSPSVQNICKDGLAAYDYLVNIQKIQPSDIILYGESIGTGVTCQISKQREAGGLILQSGFPSLVWAAQDRLWFTGLYPEQWFPNLDNLAVLKSAHPALLVVHGREDSSMPYRYAQILYDRAVGPKRLAIVDGMGHAVEPRDTAKFTEPVKSYLRTLKTASSEIEGK